MATSHTSGVVPANYCPAGNTAKIPGAVLFVLFVPGHLFDWAFEWAWLAIQLGIAFLYLLNTRTALQKTAGVPATTWLTFFVLFSVLGTLSLLYANIFLGLQVIFADIADLIRFLIFALLAIYIGTAIQESDTDGVTKALKLVLVFNLITASIILSKFPVLSDALMIVYEDAKIQYDFGHIRIGIPFQNPNFAALIFVLILSYFVFFRQSLSFALLAIVSLFITGSRSGFLAATPILLLAYIRTIKKAVSNPAVLVLILLLHLAALLYVSSLLGYLSGFARVLELINSLQAGSISDVETASIRFDLIANALTFIEMSPLIGVGPGRAYGLDITDSQLISWPLLYGIPGALLIAAFFATLFLNIARPLMKSRYKGAALATGTAFFAMLATGDFMKNYRLFFITVLVIHTMTLIAQRNSTVVRRSAAR